MSERDWREISNLKRRHMKARWARYLFIALTWVAIFLLGILLVRVGRQGLAWLDWQFLTSFPSRFPERAGIKSALAGTLWLIGLIAMIAITVGVAAAVYLEDFSRKSRLRSFI